MVGWLQWNLSQLNQFLSENRFAVPISTIENINYEKIYFYRKQEKKMTFFSGTANAPAVWGKQKSLTHILRSTFSGTFFSQLTKTSYFFRRELVSPRQALHQVRWEPNEQLPKILPRLHQNSLTTRFSQSRTQFPKNSNATERVKG